MGHSIYIGELKMSPPWSSYPDWLRFEIEPIELLGAPDFPNDDYTRRSNGRHPSYSGWAEFCDKAKLPPKFCVENPDGARRISTADLAVVDAAIERWKNMHPGTNPGFEPDELGADHPVRPAPKYEPGSDDDDVLARLLWLRWWMGWAIETCANPGVTNS